MPIYEYKCTICNERFDVEQSIKDDTLTTLPGDDHEHTVKKVFHPVGIAFKGEGFYKNDSRGSKKSSVPAPSTSDSSSPDSSGSSDSSSATSSGSDSKSGPTTSSAAATTGSSTSD